MTDKLLVDRELLEEALAATSGHPYFQSLRGKLVGLLSSRDALEVETVEVVAWLHRQGNYTEASSRPLDDYEAARGWEEEELMTVAQHERLMAAKDARLAELEAKAVPEGYAPVPVEPREAMLEVIHLLCDDPSNFDDAEAFWGMLLGAAACGEVAGWSACRSAMLAAAPQAEQVPEGWRELAKQAVEALNLFTGHDSGARLRYRYGEKWWVPLDQLREKLSATVAAPQAEQPKTGVHSTDPLACSGCPSGCFRCAQAGGDS